MSAKCPFCGAVSRFLRGPVEHWDCGSSIRRDKPVSISQTLRCLVVERDLLKARMARLEAAGDKLASTAWDADDDIREHLQVANYNLHGLLNTGERIDPPNPPQTIHQAGIDASVNVRHRLQEHAREWRKAKL